MQEKENKLPAQRQQNYCKFCMECRAYFQKPTISSQVSETKHLFHINCHQVVYLVSYFHLCPFLLPPIYQSMRPLFRGVGSRFCEAVKCFCLLFRERGGRLFGSLSAGCCCRLNGKNLQMFGVNLCIVSPLGAVLVHNLEGRGDSELCA